LVLDLKPEGHQFTKLREAVLKELSPGLRQHVLTAFWNYLLLMEIAHKIVFEESKYSYQDIPTRKAYLKVGGAYGADRASEQGDFSERLLNLVEEIAERRQVLPKLEGTAEVTELIYKHNIHTLSEALSEYLILSKKEDVWLLFDNLDKGWPVRAATEEDVLLLKCLLEATRKLQRQFDSKGVEFHAVVFIRNDIYEHLVLDPADRGKDTAVVLDWNDPEMFKEIIRRRIMMSTDLEESFNVLWALFFVSHVNGEESFSYILNKTLMRPREVLRFARECIDVAVNRGHEKVTEPDILQALHSYSEDALVDISLELKDVSPKFADVPYAFISANSVLDKHQLEARLNEAGVFPEDFGKVIDLLLWFGFLGVYASADDERYSFQFQHDLKKLQAGLVDSPFCIHPAFRSALGCPER
jgi:hypothetical protein